MVACPNCLDVEACEDCEVGLCELCCEALCQRRLGCEELQKDGKIT